jgi:Domain of unknown function (DUF4282)
MAGQPPEPSFQPAQDSGLTQGRPAWHQPSYSPPPAGASGGQQGYAAQQPPSYSQDQSYPPQDQTYTASPGGQDYSGYQGFQSGGYGAPTGQPSPGQWDSSSSGVKHAPSSSRQQASKGFIASLFDFGFENLVTPKIIKVIYILITIVVALCALGFLIVAFSTGGIVAGLLVLIIVDPILAILYLSLARMTLELYMVIFRIYDEAKQIRINTESRV